MIHRIDRLGVEPPPSEPERDGAAAVQELIGGMSTFLSYTFQSFTTPRRLG